MKHFAPTQSARVRATAAQRNISFSKTPSFPITHVQNLDPGSRGQNANPDIKHLFFLNPPPNTKPTIQSMHPSIHLNLPQTPQSLKQRKSCTRSLTPCETEPALRVAPGLAGPSQPPRGARPWEVQPRVPCPPYSTEALP